MDFKNIGVFIQELTEKLNALSPAPQSHHVNFVIFEAVSIYKATMQYWEIQGFVRFLTKCFDSRIPIGDMPGLKNDVIKLANDRFSKIDELNALTLNMKLEMMSAKIKIKWREMSDKAKQLNVLKINIKKNIPHHVSNCFMEFLTIFTNSVKTNFTKRYDEKFKIEKLSFNNLSSRPPVLRSSELKLPITKPSTIISYQSRPSSSTASTVPLPSSSSSSSYIAEPTITREGEKTWIKSKDYFNTKYHLLRDEQWEIDTFFDLIPENRKFNDSKNIKLIYDEDGKTTTGDTLNKENNKRKLNEIKNEIQNNTNTKTKKKKQKRLVIYNTHSNEKENKEVEDMKKEKEIINEKNKKKEKEILNEKNKKKEKEKGKENGKETENGDFGKAYGGLLPYGGWL